MHMQLSDSSIVLACRHPKFNEGCKDLGRITKVGKKLEGELTSQCSSYSYKLTHGVTLSKCGWSSLSYSTSEKGS